MSAWSKLVLLCAFCAIICQSPRAQESVSSTDSNSGKYTLQGLVVNSVTGDPVPYALVQVVTGSPKNAILADAAGHFELTELSAGRVLIEARKPGFQSEKPYRIGHSFSVPAADDQPLRLSLVPEAVITGHVADEQGEPIEYATVKVSWLAITNGRKSWSNIATKTTDDEGNFRIPDLRPGEYYVSMQSDLLRQVLENSGEAYAGVTYYGGGTDRSTASPLEIKAGEHTRLEFVLKPGPGFHVSGEFIGFPAGQAPVITVAGRSGDELSAGVQINPVNSTFTVPSLAAGLYVIKATDHAGDGSAIIAETTIHVSDDLTGVRLVAQSGISIPVMVHREGQPPPNVRITTGKNVQETPVFVTLEPTREPGEHVSQLQASQDGKGVALQNVSPGSYLVRVQAFAGYVRSVTCGSADLLLEDLVVPAGAAVPPIEVTMGEDTGSLTLKGLPPDPGVRTGVVIVPDSAPQHPQILGFYGGSEVTVSGLAPGDVEVFAFEDLDEVEYMNSEVLQQYASQASHVVIPANGQASVTVNVILAEGQ
jgi:hypothetical protein